MLLRVLCFVARLADTASGAASESDSDSWECSESFLRVIDRRNFVEFARQKSESKRIFLLVTLSAFRLEGICISSTVGFAM